MYNDTVGKPAADVSQDHGDLLWVKGECDKKTTARSEMATVKCSCHSGESSAAKTRTAAAVYYGTKFMLRKERGATREMLPATL
jgi:glutamate dehydrogenase/leucine dehydrogenase